MHGISAKEVSSLLGDMTLDVFLNDAAYWRKVPLNVWEYHIGGYQVIKKWLSYREQEILDRALNARAPGAETARAVLFYLDPPYLLESRTTKGAFGKFDMTVEQHEEFLNAITGLQGMVMISGYASQLYDSLLGGAIRRAAMARSGPKSHGQNIKPQREET